MMRTVEILITVMGVTTMILLAASAIGSMVIMLLTIALTPV